MSEPATTEPFGAKLPRWQVLAILVGFPIAYWINGFLPWSYGLFVRRDHGYFIPFGLSICTLHWASLALMLAFVRRAGGRASDIGLNLRAGGLAMYGAVVVVIGGLLIGFRQAFPIHAEPPGDWRFHYPFTLAERCFFIFLAISAGFCEEAVYRGFAITALSQRDWKTWQTVLFSSLSFIGIHGIAGLFLSPFLLAVGLIYAGLFLWRRNLTPLIYLHTLFDVTSVAAI